ncbi:hypothetical protein NMY22_g17952 [Coprinellus aureogranulatus]|nr:hypothetical protein NMY22_g17952 [Coprinellus aureogranulatus]
MDWDAIYEQDNQRERFSAQRSALLDDDDDNNDVPMDAFDDPSAAGPIRGDAPGTDTGRGGTPQTPLEQMMRHWLNERHAPDILPAQEELLAGLLDHLRVQVSTSFPPSPSLLFPLPSPTPSFPHPRRRSGAGRVNE